MMPLVLIALLGSGDAAGSDYANQAYTIEPSPPGLIFPLGT